VEHRDEIQERRHEPQVVDERDQRCARENDGERSVSEEPAIGFPGEQRDERRVQRERDEAGNEVGMHTAERQHAVGRGKILPRQQAHDNAAPQQDKAAEVDDDHRLRRRPPSLHGQPSVTRRRNYDSASRAR